MNTNEIVATINELISDLPQNMSVCVLDEDGNDTDLRLDGFSYDDNIKELPVVNIWCHQV